jgi:hypothetical protein
MDGVSNANIIVDYQGFTPPLSFRYYCLSNILKSDVTVRVAFINRFGSSVLKARQRVISTETSCVC